MRLTCVLLGVLLQHGGPLLVAAGRVAWSRGEGVCPTIYTLPMPDTHQLASVELSSCSLQRGPSLLQASSCKAPAVQPPSPPVRPEPPAVLASAPPQASSSPLAHLRSPTVRFSLCTLRSTNRRWSAARLRSPYLRTAATGKHMGGVVCVQTPLPPLAACKRHTDITGSGAFRGLQPRRGLLLEPQICRQGYCLLPAAAARCFCCPLPPHQRRRTTLARSSLRSRVW